VPDLLVCCTYFVVFVTVQLHELHTVRTVFAFPTTCRCGLLTFWLLHCLIAPLLSSRDAARRMDLPSCKELGRMNQAMTGQVAY
jgi:hypothetical protein